MRRFLTMIAAIVIACSLAGCSAKKYGADMTGSGAGGNSPVARKRGRKYISNLTFTASSNFTTQAS